MIDSRHGIDFPAQRVSSAEKNKESWYANCIDYVIQLGINRKNRSDIETKINILHGNIPDSFYKKTLNPYNANNERYLHFPATMRNLDIMSDIIRRYVSEYFKSIHEFIVCANNPEVVLRKNKKLEEEVLRMAEQAFTQAFEQRLAEMQNQAMQNGEDPNNINPQEAMPDVEQFIKDFNENYIDDLSKQGQDVLDYIRSMTEDMHVYLSAYFDYCALGECYTYTAIRGEELQKEHISLLEAYPIPNSNFFVEDHDMFARRMLLSYNQIIDMFDEVLTKKDRDFLDDYYKDSDISTAITYQQYLDYTPAGCEKFTESERTLFKETPEFLKLERDGELFEVWHVVWRGEAKRGIVKYINELGFEDEKIVDEGYHFDAESGDISIEWKYEPQIYEGYRIGTRYTGIYPIKAKPIPYQRNGKLPYNGINGVLPNMGKFSIVSLITPYQILRNIISYHREMVIAKNKMLVLLIPQSLMAGDTEDKIYRMAADGVLYVDDTDDLNSQKMANIRMLNANMGDYITQLTNLMDALKYEAREMVDMNMQRYGEIAQSAGQATTQEAVARSSMGSVIITTMFDEMRARDYQRDIDFAKLAYIDGLQISFVDSTYKQRYLSLDVDSFINTDCSIIVKNNQKETDKLEQLKQWAFSAAQNGDLDMAIAAITGNNVTQIKDTVEKFMEIKRQHEEQMQQADQILKQEEMQAKLMEIQAKGEEDRKTLATKYQYEMGLQSMAMDAENLANGANQDDTANQLKLLSEQNKTNIAKEKLDLDKAKLNSDLLNSALDRQLKREEMKNQLKIATVNKNKYDK